MLDILTSLPELFGPTLLLICAALAFGESTVGLGVLVPGETAVLVLGAASGTATQLMLSILVVVLAASAADHVGYMIGRRWGGRIRLTRLVQRLGTEHWDEATKLLHDRGATAIVASRLLPLVRTLVPAAAGAARLRYHRFLRASLLGSALWAVLWISGGALAGRALPEVAALLGRGTWVALGLVAAAGALVVWRRRRGGRAARRRSTDVPPPAANEAPEGTDRSPALGNRSSRLLR